MHCTLSAQAGIDTQPGKRRRVQRASSASRAGCRPPGGASRGSPALVTLPPCTQGFSWSVPNRQQQGPARAFIRQLKSAHLLLLMHLWQALHSQQVRCRQPRGELGPRSRWVLRCRQHAAQHALPRRRGGQRRWGRRRCRRLRRRRRLRLLPQGGVQLLHGQGCKRGGCWWRCEGCRCQGPRRPGCGEATC